MIKQKKIFLSKMVIPAVFSFFLVFLLYSGALSKQTSGKKKEQIKAIESKLSSEKEKFDIYDSQEKGLLARLAGLEKEVSEKKSAVNVLKKKIRLAKSNVKGLDKKILDLKALLRKAEIRMSERLVSLYKYARKGYLRTLADAGDLDQFWHRMKYATAIVEEDKKVLEGLADKAFKYKIEILQAQERVDKTRAVIAKEEVHFSSLRKELEKKVLHLMKIHKEKEFYETSVKELEFAAERLKETLIKIEKKEIYKTPLSSRFIDAKGQLPLPLEGKVIRGGNQMKSEGIDFHKGIFIEDSSDREARAIFPGRVDFSGRLKGYGKVIIINHGSRFFTITAQLFQRKKNEGDVVAQGEIIGLAGRFLKGTRVYFEIRRAGKSLDPLKWLKVS
ncbi:MAG TPA: hypothetical protein DDW42_01935 [Desulfobacteraceae bacterium]|nr:hypothetical protein [Desulfobacteraceae bacterium]